MNFSTYATDTVRPPGMAKSFNGRPTWQVPSVDICAREDWEDRLALHVEMLSQTGRFKLAMFIVELPGLMQIAETFGSHVHSSLLQEAVTRIAEAFGPGAVARHDDYSVILAVDEAGEEDTTRIAHMVHRAIRQCRSEAGVMIVGVPLIGAALYAQAEEATDSSPDHSRHLAGRSGRIVVSCLIRRAELALHRAKRGQAGACTLYTPTLKAQLRDETETRQRLLHAIDRQEFSLAYQPIVELNRMTTVGFEALIRWNSATGTLCGGPAEFIPIAEETGLIVPIGAQVIESAMRQAGAWCAAGLKPPRIAVNVSAEQLADPRFLETVSDSLERAGLQPHALELELTERTLVASACNTIRLLEHLQELGIVVSVDDFGTGYSALRYLQDLPISKLKIDRCFVMRLTNLPREQAMVRAMICLATSFDLDVVAEGIETQEQLDILRRLGCASGQGYLFSKALPASQAEVWIGSTWN